MYINISNKIIAFFGSNIPLCQIEL